MQRIVMMFETPLQNLWVFYSNFIFLIWLFDTSVNYIYLQREGKKCYQLKLKYGKQPELREQYEFRILLEILPSSDPFPRCTFSRRFYWKTTLMIVDAQSFPQDYWSIIVFIMSRYNRMKEKYVNQLFRGWFSAVCV